MKCKNCGLLKELHVLGMCATPMKGALGTKFKEDKKMKLEEYYAYIAAAFFGTVILFSIIVMIIIIIHFWRIII